MSKLNSLWAKWIYPHPLTDKKNKLIMLCALLSGAIALCFVVFESYTSYRSELRSASFQTKNITSILADDLSTTIGRIDFSLIAIQKYLENEKNLAKKASTYNKLLHEEKKRTRGVLNFKIINKNGDNVGDSDGEREAVNHSDRDYFKVLKFSKLNTLVLSTTLNQSGIILARPLLDKDKNFNGLVLGTLDLIGLRDILSKINVGEDGISALIGNDTTVHVGRPLNEKIESKVTSTSRIFDFIESLEKEMSGIITSPVDGVERSISVEKVEQGKFLIIVGFSLDYILANWKKRTVIYFTLTLSLVVGFLICVLKLLLSSELLEDKKRQSAHSAKLASIGELSSGIAHEVNNPLAIIIGQVSVIKKLTNEGAILLDERIEKGIERISIQSKRMAKIISGLQSFSRDSSSDSFELVSVRQIILNSMSSCTEASAAAGVKIIFNTEDERDVFIECRAIQIEQVFINLINNACDAIAHLEAKWISISCQEIGDIVKIIVTDSGYGISEEVAVKIMEPFYTTKEVGKGTGLGLSISQGIMKSHFGKLYLDDSQKNTTFVIELNKSISFDDAIESHLEWKNKIARYMDNPNGELKPDHICADNLCELGKWIYSKENKYGKIHEWQDLKEKHAKFHQIAGKLISDVNKGIQYKKSRLFSRGSRYDMASRKTTDAILNLKKKIIK